MHILLLSVFAAGCVLSSLAASAQTKAPGLSGAPPSVEAPLLEGPSIRKQLPLPDASRLQSFTLNDQGKAVLGLRGSGEQDTGTAVLVPHAPGDDFARNERLCFAMRSYLFSHDDQSPDAPRMTGYTTCVAAGKVHAKDAAEGVFK